MKETKHYRIYLLYIESLNVTVLVVKLDKNDLPEPTSQETVYRMAFNLLLTQINNFAEQQKNKGFLLLDSRSSQYANFDDRRLIDVFNEWQENLNKPSQFFEVPWFGSSNFYAGLQIADFMAYLMNLLDSETIDPRDKKMCENFYQKIKNKVITETIPKDRK